MTQHVHLMQYGNQLLIPLLLVIGVVFVFSALQSISPVPNNTAPFAIAGNVNAQSLPNFSQISSHATDIFYYPPSVRDIDNDGKPEIVASNERAIYVWKKNGRLMNGWPYTTTTSNFYFAPSLADTDNDYYFEIFGGAEGTQELGLSFNGTTLAGFPQSVGTDHLRYATALGDLDGDGDLELVNGTTTIQPNLASVYVWSHNGTLFPGWPKNVQYSRTNNVSIGDLDGDNDLEVTATDPLQAYVWNDDGTNYPGWPLIPQPQLQSLPGCGVNVNSLDSSAIGDIDNDNSPDVVIATFNFGLANACRRIWVHAFHANGTELLHFPVEITGYSPADRSSVIIADLENDGQLEIIIATSLKIIIVKSDGTTNSFPATFPAAFGTFFEPVVANIDGDVEMEIVTSTKLSNLPYPEDSTGAIYAWNHDGTLVSGFPIPLLPQLGMLVPTSMLTITDLDQDGAPEVIGGYASYGQSGDLRDGGLYIQKLPGTLGRIEWETHGQNVRHTYAHP